MSIIQVITFANIKKIIGKKQFTMEAESVKDLLDKLLEEYGKELKDELFDELGKIRSFYRIIVNGRNINLLDGFQTKLKDDDMFVLMPAIAGG
jgi:MoaD family protein